MKHILIITLVLMSFISSPSSGETMDDLVKREGTYYKKFTDVPFTGEVEGKRQGSFKNGEREGPWVAYWDNGQLMYKGYYKNGEEEGPWETYLNNGRLVLKGDYKNGKRDGYWVSYTVDGFVLTAITGTYKDGVKISD